MENIFIESVNKYNGLDDTRKDAIVSLYRTLFEADESTEKKDEQKEEKKDDAKDDAKDDSDSSEKEPFNIIRNRTPSNMTPSKNRKIQYIALHYTAGNSSKTGSATRTVFPAKCSADFIVDDGEIYQYNPDLDNYYTWAVGVTRDALEEYKKTAKIGGAAQYHNKATNANTISIEMCSNYKGKREKGTSPFDPNFYLTEATLANTAKLVAYLMKKYPGVQIVRHFDITGKPCPGPWTRDNEGDQAFRSFVSRCGSTPPPPDPAYQDVEDNMMEKDEQPPWPDFGRFFAPDKTATAAETVASNISGNNVVDGFLGAIKTPVGKLIADVIVKNNGQVSKDVVKDFANMVAKNSEMLKNVLKLVPKK